MKSLAHRLTDKYIALMLLVYPLWTGLDGYGNITRWKFVFFAVVTCIWAVLLIFFVIREQTAPRRCGVFTILCAAFLAWACVSAACSEYGSQTLLGYRYDGLLVLALYGVTALGCALYGEFKESYVYLLAVSVTLCCAVAILQLCGFNPLRLYPEGLGYYDAGVSYSGAFLGTIGNTNLLGAFLCLSCPLFAFTAAEKRGKRLWLLLPAALGTAVIVLSQSEAGLVGLAAALLMGIVCYVNLHLGRKAALIALGIEAAFVLLALAAVYFAASENGTLYELHEILHGRVRDEFGSSRVAIWREALRLFSERPVTGGGPGTFGFRSALEFSRYVPETGLTLTTRADNAHCEALSCLVNLGVPGALLYIALAAYVLRLALCGASAAIGLALLSYFVQALFGISTCFILPFVALLAGLASAGGSGQTSIRTE